MKQEQKAQLDWNLMLIAMCDVEPGPLVEQFSHSVSAFGGFVHQLAELCRCTRQLGHEVQGTSARINLSVYAREAGESFLGGGGSLQEAA